MNGESRGKRFCFAPNLIGDALAHIVSELEGETYTYESLEVYERGWRRGQGVYINYFDTMAIVKQGLSKCRFCLNDDSPWMYARLAHILSCTMHWPSQTVNYEIPVNFADEFSSQNCPFPYLNDFLAFLKKARSSEGKLTKETVMELANDFVTKQQTSEKAKMKIKR